MKTLLLIFSLLLSSTTYSAEHYKTKSFNVGSVYCDIRTGRKVRDAVCYYVFKEDETTIHCKEATYMHPNRFIIDKGVYRVSKTSYEARRFLEEVAKIKLGKE
jgi:hypothetical protein